MKILAVLSVLLLAACEPMPTPDSGLDAQTDVQAVDSSTEAASDAMPPHVDGGGID